MEDDRAWHQLDSTAAVFPSTTKVASRGTARVAECRKKYNPHGTINNRQRLATTQLKDR
jgi:hypothetical protein